MTRYLKHSFIVLFILSLVSCSKETIAELKVEYTLGENGSINILAAADNAVLYRFSFANDEVFENTSGSINYTYGNKGSYTIGIWSFFDQNQNSYSYQTIEVTISNASGNSTAVIDESLIDNSEETTIYTGYELVWNDEFNYEGEPSTLKWHHQYIPIFGGGWANNERQHYTERLDNSYVSDGTLKIVAKREDYTYEGSRKTFTSARLNSKFNMLYGRIDVRAKLPQSEGTWPAIWTLGTNIGERGNYYGTTDGDVGWPNCGEIDIMEQNGSNKDQLLGTFHWANQGSGEYASYGLTKTIENLNISNVTDNFHLYSMIWTPNLIKLLVDDTLLVQLGIGTNAPFDNPHYLLLNIAMGGTLGGTIPNSFSEDSMEIDYVRFYQ